MFEKLFAKRGFSIERLHSFLKVASAGGIARAVGSDPVRQSQFCRQIKELEEFFGVTLLMRSGKNLKLTPAGERLASAGREAFHALADFRSLSANEPVTFTLGAGDSLIQWLVLPRVGALRREFPNVNFRVRNLRSRDVVTGLRELRIDFGLVRREVVTKPIASAPLGVVDYALFIPRGLLPRASASSRKNNRRAEFDFAWAMQNLPVATLAGDGHFSTRLEALSAKLRLDAPPRLFLECESFPHARSALESGHCAAILPKLAARELSGAKPRRFIELPAPPALNQPRRAVVLAWNPRLLQLRESAPALREQLSAVLKF